MARYRLSAEAIRDLDAVSDYIMEDNPLRAISFVDEIVGKFSVIADRPLSFSASGDLPAGLRSALHGNYRIIFEVNEGTPDILRVLHGVRDIGNLFEIE